MQDRYAGDVGDFAKFAILRSLMKGRTLGVCWYRCAGAGESNNDGKHVAYLDRPDDFRHLEPEVFDMMKHIVASDRSLTALERSGLLPGAVFHGDEVPLALSRRLEWSRAMQSAVTGCDFVFVDPDNGFEGASLGPKCAARDEVRALLKPGRALLLYHHQTRRRGGAAADFDWLCDWLSQAGARTVEAVRLRVYSSRFYVLADADDGLSQAMRTLAERWGNHRAEYFARRPMLRRAR